MILQQLYQDAEAILQESLPPPMYDVRPVAWIVRLSADGRLEGFVRTTEKRGTPRLVPYRGRTSGIRAILLADYPAYVLGIDCGEKVEKNVDEKHAAFKSLTQQCLLETGNALVQAVNTFLSSWDPRRAEIPPEMTNQDILTFQVQGQWPIDAEDVRQFWARTTEPEQSGSAERAAQCLVTGRIGPVEKSLPGMIKGVPGGQTTGVAMISANEDAFESYGFKRAQTSPVCREAAERFTKALNHLIRGDRTHITIGGLVYVFWTQQGADEEIIDFVDNPDSDQVRRLLDSYRTGLRFTALDDEQFYAFALSASGSRAVVRDWMRTTVRETRANLSRWFEAQRIVTPDGSDGDFFGIYKLAAGLYRDASKEMSQQVPRSLMQAALHGNSIPGVLLNLAVKRCRAKQSVTRNCAALIKAIYVSRESDRKRREEIALKMYSLDTQNSSPAYLCGRLLAELERIQRRALGNINRTLVERYYGAASATPRFVLANLVKEAVQGHLSKIRRRDGYAAYSVSQKRLEEILSRMSPQEFPRTLSMDEQALFALGFYHQRAANRAAAIEAAERKRQGRASEEDEALAEDGSRGRDPSASDQTTLSI